MVLLCTSTLQESISDPALLNDFESSGYTLLFLGVGKRLTETPCIYLVYSVELVQLIAILLTVNEIAKGLLLFYYLNFIKIKYI